MTNEISYKNSGVDINEGNLLVEDIKSDIKATNRAGVMGGFGGFGGLFDLKECGFKDPILVSATDGVGTKLKIAIELNEFSGIGQDLVAMCVNDLVVQGAEPLFFLDYYACGKLDREAASLVVKSIAKACKMSGSALIGGETAEMPGMYKDKDFDLAGFSVGAVERDKMLPKKDQIKNGDILIGLKSSGVHSNGFSLVRKIMEVHGLTYKDKAEFDESKSYGQVFLEPTRIYVKSCLEIHKKGLAKAFCHITGGGLIENLPRILPEGARVSIDYENFELPKLFSWLQERAGIEREELFKTFNCGVGMVVVVDASKKTELINLLESLGEEIVEVGEIIL